MVRPKRQLDSAGSVPSALVRTRAARDMIMRSIHNLSALAHVAKVDTEKHALFKARYVMLDRYVNQFDDRQQEVLSIMADSELQNVFNSTDVLVTDEMEELCANIRMVAELIVPPLIEPRQERAVSSGTTIVLPKIEVPKFDGDVVQWGSFRDLFLSLIHHNTTISNVERFHYLKSSLLGPALAVIKPISLTADNYEIAWRALQNAFENNRLLATAHIDKLFSFSPIRTESPAALAAFVNIFRENVAAIKALGVEDIAGFLLFYIGARALDIETRKLYEASISQSDIPTLDNLLEFVSQRCKILENIGTISERTEVGVKVMAKGRKGGLPEKSVLTVTTEVNRSKCLFCKRDHPIFRCAAFRQNLISARRKFVIQHGICFVCLNTGHQAKACSSGLTCRHCGRKHNTLLHIDGDKSTNASSTKYPTETVNNVTEATEANTAASSSTAKFSGTACTESTVVLGTAVVRIRDSLGQLQAVGVLLDSGSQVSAITSNCANRLRLSRTKSRVEVTGLAEQPVNKVKGATQCQFVPLHAKEPQFQTSGIVILAHITTQLPGDRLPAAIRDRYRHLVLADPEFDVPGPVDMLIGSDLYPHILQPRADIIHTVGLPSAMSTHLGWIIVGALGERPATPMVSLSVRITPEVDGLLQKFWNIEEPDLPDTPTTEDEQCEEFFQKSTSRDAFGRFYVALPFRSTVCAQMEAPIHGGSAFTLGPSHSLALNRLRNLERRLIKDPELYDAYRKFMNEYPSLGHMKLASVPGKYFIPHHPVVKRGEKGLKIRVVFDASAKSATGRSLNDCARGQNYRLRSVMYFFAIDFSNTYALRTLPKCIDRSA